MACLFMGFSYKSGNPGLKVFQYETEDVRIVCICVSLCVKGAFLCVCVRVLRVSVCVCMLGRRQPHTVLHIKIVFPNGFC